MSFGTEQTLLFSPNTGRRQLPKVFYKKAVLKFCNTHRKTPVSGLQLY